MKQHKRIYTEVYGLLSVGSMTRERLVSEVAARLDRKSEYPTSELRARIGEVLNEMESGGIIRLTDGAYSLASSAPVFLRAERCEKAILDFLRSSPASKQQIRNALERRFGTDKTVSTRDDNILHTFIGQILKRLTALGVLTADGSLYAISPEKAAHLDDIGEMLILKGDFLTRLHSRGGEFFEHYFMTLIGKFLSKHGKTVTECHATGGAADGGIDGIIRTTDPLGFRELILVQVKNRLEDSNETTVRGFVGAVYAAQGSRGIFATTSGFHPSARKFLDGLDNCVGIDGDMIFRMACECLYGIKKRSGKYILDTKAI